MNILMFFLVVGASLRFFEALDEGGNCVVAAYFGRGTALWGFYDAMCCRQMGQFRCSRVELRRQEMQNVWPQESVAGLLKTVIQIGHTIY